MKIVVLDGHTSNPGDLSWDELEKLGDTTIYDRTQNEEPTEVISRAVDAEIVLTNKTLLTKEAIQQLPKLRYIGVLATGYNVVDIAAAQKREIVVTNIPAYSTASVAQSVFAHLLNLTQHVGEHADSVRRGDWCASQDFAYWNFPLVELEGLTLGIVGYGQIGQSTAAIGRVFGMNILANNRSPKQVPSCEATMVTLDELLKTSDVVSLHCPLTDENEGMINTAALSKMKETAFLINTARGPLIDETALAESLNSGQISGAGLDVLSEEPASPDCPLLTAQNCYITPHLAWASVAARRRLIKTAIANIQAFLDGKWIQNRVGKPRDEKQS